jgi:hypothetical protein
MLIYVFVVNLYQVFVLFTIEDIFLDLFNDAFSTA